MCVIFVALALGTSGDVEVIGFFVHIRSVVARAQGCVRLVGAEMSKYIVHKTKQVLAQVANAWNDQPGTHVQ